MFLFTYSSLEIPLGSRVILYTIGKVFVRRLQRHRNRRKRFSSGGEIPGTSLTIWILGGELILETLPKGGQIIHLGINTEDSRKPGQYRVPSYFLHIFSFTHRILDKFGIYGKLSSRTIQRYLGRGDRTRTHGERGKLLVLII